MSPRRQDVARFFAGVLISVIFLAATLSRVDLRLAAAAIADAAPAWLAVAVLISIADLALRARRWQVLLHGVDGAPERIPYRLALGYLSIGYLANAILPARLGDVARAVLAGTRFRMSRLAVFGTILVERITDGLLMLGLAALSSLAVAGIAEPGALTAYGIAVVAGGTVVALVGWHLVSRSALAGTRIGAVIVQVVRRLSAGGGALRHPASATTFLALTAAAALTALLVAWTVSRAVGVQLSPLETVLFLSTIALSLAIPAAPGSLGTYEFVGVTILTSLGYSPEQGLATILLMRLVATVPQAITGLVSAFVLHVRPRTVVQPVEANAGLVAAE
jgi:uncharacterized membrane protein YbhN (UPF0104 family)